VTLTWRALSQPIANYTGFVQLLDSAGRLVAQQDHPLTNNFMPSTLWQPGLTVADEYKILLPTTLAVGKYHLIVGLYDGATGGRLPVTVDAVAVGDTVTISNVIVSE